MYISCDTLYGLTYNNDAHKVHQPIHVFLKEEGSENCIKPRENKRDVCIGFKALQVQYGGKWNKYVRIKESDILRNKLHYKNGRYVSFEKFLTNMKYTFESPRLTQVKNAFQVSSDLDQDKSGPFEFITNSMADEAASLR